MTRDADIARIVKALDDALAHPAMTASSNILDGVATALYDAGLRPSVEPAGTRCDFDCDACRAPDDTEGAG